MDYKTYKVIEAPLIVLAIMLISAGAVLLAHL